MNNYPDKLPGLIKSPKIQKQGDVHTVAYSSYALNKFNSVNFSSEPGIFQQLNKSVSKTPRLKQPLTPSLQHTERIDAFYSTESVYASYHPICGTDEVEGKTDTSVCSLPRDSETGELKPGEKSVEASGIKSDGKGKRKIEGEDAWITLAAVTTANILNGINWISFAFIYVELCETFDVNRSTAGWVGSIHNSVSLMMGLVVSAPVQTFGCKAVEIAGGIIMCAGILLSSLAPNVYVMYLTYGVIGGIGSSMRTLPNTVIIQQHFNYNRSIATAISMLGGSVGQVIGPLLMAYLNERYGWRGALLIFSALILNSIPLCMIYRKPKILINAPKQKKDFKTMMTHMFDFSLMKHLTFVLFCLSFFIIKFNILGFYQHLPSRLVNQGVSKHKAAILMSVMGGFSAVSRLGCGFIGNLKCSNRIIMFSTAAVCAGIDTIVLALVSDFSVQLMSTCLFGVFLGCTMLMVSIVLVDLLGVEMIARSRGIFNAFSGAAGLLAVPFAGWLFDVSNSYNFTYFVIGAIGLAGGLLSWIVYILDRRSKRVKKLETAEEKCAEITDKLLTEEPK